jgi:hypothetical protein
MRRSKHQTKKKRRKDGINEKSELKFQKTASSNYRVECWEVKQFQKEAEQEF